MDDDTSRDEPVISGFFKEELALWTSPARLKKKHLWFLSAAALTTVFLVNNDTRINKGTQHLMSRSGFLKGGSPMVTKLGSVSFSLGIVGSFYLSGIVFNDYRAKETAQLGLKSLLHGFLISQLMKRGFRRQRPYVNDGKDGWFNKGSGNDYRSFPSGHTTAAWSLATVISGMYKDKPAVPIVCYSLATLVGFSRMTEKKHWASDVLVGALLGYAIGKFVLKNRSNRFMITPTLGNEQVGLGVTYAF